MGLFAVLTALCCLLLQSASAASSTFSPARPPAFPLAVKSPYLSTWLNVGSDGGNGGLLAGEWPTHWTGKITGWTGFVRVDGKPFQFLGNAPGITNVNQLSASYTSTKSIFVMDVNGQVRLTITFLSPVTPNDYARLSLPFSYMQVSAQSSDGKSHRVQVYTDISGEWASGERNVNAQWDYSTSGNVSYHRVYRQQQLTFAESDEPSGNGMASWGEVYYATSNVGGMTRQSGQDSVVRGQFMQNGVLTNGADTQFRNIQDRWPVFAFANDLGTVAGSARSVLYTIGLAQKQAIQFLGANGQVVLPALWTSYWSNSAQACAWFHNDYQNMNSISTNLDNKVQTDSVNAASQNYATITSLSVRQAFAALELVGTPSNMYLFMKEISSNGNTQTVDVMFPLHPILLYMNPNLLQLMLKPLFENQESGKYPNKYAMHDLGTHFPNATGHTDGNDEKMPVEESGNMLIMSLGYAQRTKDTAWLNSHYNKLVQWTQFLIDDSLIPDNQLSTDDFAGTLSNQTNLALKGIIGIEAMAGIAYLTGRTDDAAKYTNISHSYIAQWQQLAITQTGLGIAHTTLDYGQEKSFGLLYNLWPDRALGLNLVPQSVYAMQSNFYPTVAQKYGVPLDSRHFYTKLDWEAWAAATCSVQTRDLFFQSIVNWMNNTPTNKALTDLYDTISGDYPGIFFIARPVVGGTFALLVSGQTNNGYTGFARDGTQWRMKYNWSVDQSNSTTNATSSTMADMGYNATIPSRRRRF